MQRECEMSSVQRSALIQRFALDAELGWRAELENGNGLVAAVIATPTAGIKTFNFSCLTPVTAENHAACKTCTFIDCVVVCARGLMPHASLAVQPAQACN